MSRMTSVHPLSNKSLFHMFSLSVCSSSEGFCERASSVGPEGLDQPAETHHSDGRGAGSSLRAVEDPKRNRCCMSSDASQKRRTHPE